MRGSLGRVRGNRHSGASAKAWRVSVTSVHARDALRAEPDLCEASAATVTPVILSRPPSVTPRPHVDTGPTTCRRTDRVGISVVVAVVARPVHKLVPGAPEASDVQGGVTRGKSWCGIQITFASLTAAFNHEVAADQSGGASA